MTRILEEAEQIARRVTGRPIVIATIARPTGWTGVHTHFTEFMRLLASRHHPVTLVTPVTGQDLLANAVFAPRAVLSRIHPAANVWWYEAGHFHMLRRALHQVLASAGEVTVYAQCPLSAQAALEVRAGRHQRVVMAVHFNSSQADEWVNQAGLSPRSRVYAAIRERERRILPTVDGLVYVSDFMRRTLEASVPGLSNVPSTVIPNFVSGRPSSAPAAITGDLISIGTLEPRKNQAYLLHVLHEADRLGHRYTLTLAGDGPDRPTLEALASRLGISEQVRFLGFEPNARRLLPAHRAYVHAALSENLPLVLIEALAAGRPVLAGPVGGVPEVYRDGVEGYYWHLDDPVRAAKILVSLLEDEGQWSNASRAARDRFESVFESERAGTRLFEFLVS